MDDDAEEFVEVAEWDWVLSGEGTMLHHLASLDDPDAAGFDWGGPGVLTCGAKSEWVSIPGIFTRMGARRCAACCRALGWPEGVGSPKNSDELRPLVEARLASANAAPGDGSNGGSRTGGED